MRANTRERFAAIALATVLASVVPGRAQTSTPSPADFRAFLEKLRPEAERRGVSGAVFDAAVAGLTPDPAVAAMTGRQPEELKTVGAYLAAQVTEPRIAAGRALMARWGADLGAIERRSGVPGAIVIAVWGLETSYGASTGRKDVIRSLATLAAMNYRPDLYRAELLAALAMLGAGDVRRDGFRGSWAGAMGQPQFMPSSYGKYAVDGDGDGRRDIWASVPDALASIANFLRSQGWRPDRPWGFEVRVPAGFDYRVGRADYGRWAALGLTRADGTPLPAEGEATLLFLAGFRGPAFLVTENHEVLKSYNFSDAYALAVAQLAARMDGGRAVRAAWPADPPMSRQDRIALQARLAEMGYAVDNREGRVSLALRDVIRAAQAGVNMVPDGNPTLALLDALRAAGGTRADRP